VPIRILRQLAAVASALLAASLLLAASPAQAASPEVVHQKIIQHETETLDTYCGEVAVFQFDGTETFTLVDKSDGIFTWTVASRATYTLTFLDSSLGVQEGRFSQMESVHAAPGGTFVFRFVINDRQGAVRSHSTTTFVVSADGTIRVDKFTFVVDGCP
jgi:outer membrane biogenesis lipoprotein LolB